jgi:hypothetical protein
MKLRGTSQKKSDSVKLFSGIFHRFFDQFYAIRYFLVVDIDAHLFIPSSVETWETWGQTGRFPIILPENMAKAGHRSSDARKTFRLSPVFDWFNPAPSAASFFLHHATQIKNIWVPYGE